MKEILCCCLRSEMMVVIEKYIITNATQTHWYTLVNVDEFKLNLFNTQVVKKEYKEGVEFFVSWHESRWFLGLIAGHPLCSAVTYNYQIERRTRECGDQGERIETLFHWHCILVLWRFLWDKNKPEAEQTKQYRVIVIHANSFLFSFLFFFGFLSTTISGEKIVDPRQGNIVVVDRFPESPKGSCWGFFYFDNQLS